MPLLVFFIFIDHPSNNPIPQLGSDSRSNPCADAGSTILLLSVAASNPLQHGRPSILIQYIPITSHEIDQRRQSSSKAYLIAADCESPAGTSQVGARLSKQVVGLPSFEWSPKQISHRIFAPQIIFFFFPVATELLHLQPLNLIIISSWFSHPFFSLSISRPYIIQGDTRIEPTGKLQATPAALTARQSQAHLHRSSCASL